jgi:hypothetical protein
VPTGSATSKVAKSIATIRRLTVELSGARAGV